MIVAIAATMRTDAARHRAGSATSRSSATAVECRILVAARSPVVSAHRVPNMQATRHPPGAGRRSRCDAHRAPAPPAPAGSARPPPGWSAAGGWSPGSAAGALLVVLAPAFLAWELVTGVVRAAVALADGIVAAGPHRGPGAPVGRAGGRRPGGPQRAAAGPSGGGGGGRGGRGAGVVSWPLLNRVRALFADA